MNKKEVEELINKHITDNEVGDITAQKLREVLHALNKDVPVVVDELGKNDKSAISQRAVTEVVELQNERFNNFSESVTTQLNSLGYTYTGTATPSTTPIALIGDEKVFYIATEEGDYTNFDLGNISELSIIKRENGSWKAEGLGIEFSRSLKKLEAETIIGGKYVNKYGTSLELSAARSVALFNIEAFKGYKINVVVPQTATEYATLYAYSNDGSAFYAPAKLIDSPTQVLNYEFSIDSAENYKYLAINYTTAKGVPAVSVNQSKYYTKQEVDDIISAVEEIIDNLEESLQDSNIAPSEIISRKYITPSSTITESSSASIAFYEVKGLNNVKVHVPKSGNEYTILYAYSDEIVSNGEIIAPENTIKGNNREHSFTIPNSRDKKYAAICFIESAGLPTVTPPTEVDMLELKVDKNTESDKSIIRSIANNKKSDVCDKIRPMKVLFIANSFAVQATELLPELLTSKQRDIIIGISYVGGGTLSTYNSRKESSEKDQYVKYKGGEWVYEGISTINLSEYNPSNTYNVGDHCKYDSNGGTAYIAYRCVKETTGEFDPSCWVRATKSNTLIDKLDDENWDVVFFIQGSAYAGLYSSYEPYFSSLLRWLPSKIQSLGYRVGWFMPWAWSNEKITTEGGNKDGGVSHDEMYANICSATEQNIITHKDDIDLFCPCGTAVENQLNYHSSVWADGQHVTPYGAYSAAMVLYDALSKYFFKEGLVELAYDTKIGIGEVVFNRAKTSALNALASPYNKTIV